MVVAKALQLRCSLEESSSDLARMDDADTEAIFDGGGPATGANCF